MNIEVIIQGCSSCFFMVFDILPPARRASTCISNGNLCPSLPATNLHTQRLSILFLSAPLLVFMVINAIHEFHCLDIAALETPSAWGRPDNRRSRKFMDDQNCQRERKQEQPHDAPSDKKSSPQIRSGYSKYQHENIQSPIAEWVQYLREMHQHCNKQNRNHRCSI